MGAAAETPATRLVRAYQRHGAMLSAHVLGQYAAVIVDTLARRVLLVQDSLGLRPLFYTLDRTHVVVSSDLDNMVAFVRPASINEAYFAEALLSGSPPRQRTPFQGIERLTLGRTLLIERLRVTTLQPWLPPMTEQIMF